MELLLNTGPVLNASQDTLIKPYYSLAKVRTIIITPGFRQGDWVVNG